MDKAVPIGINKIDFEEKIKIFEKLLGTQWLENQIPNKSSFSTLWIRKDTLASVELYTIANAIESLNLEQNTKWLDEFVKAIKTNRDTDVISNSYEIISAAMFSKNQKVNISEYGNPGYDFEIHINNKTIRVSCKKLQISNEERTFYREMKMIYNTTLSMLGKLQLSGLQIVLINIKIEEPVALEDMRNQIEYCLSEYKISKEFHAYKIGGWLINIIPLTCEEKGFYFHNGIVSFKFLGISPYKQEEQNRFENLFRRAASNVKQHCNKIDNDNINMIMIGVPTSISIKTAEGWIQDKFKREYSTITAVILNRTQYIKMEDTSEMCILNEIATISNPNAKVKLHEFYPEGYTLKSEIPFGLVTLEESKNKLFIGDERFDIDDSYIFQKGQIFHEHVNGEMSYTFKNEPGIKYVSIFKPDQCDKPLFLEPGYPPDSNFLLI